MRISVFCFPIDSWTLPGSSVCCFPKKVNIFPPLLSLLSGPSKMTKVAAERLLRPDLRYMPTHSVQECKLLFLTRLKIYYPAEEAASAVQGGAFSKGSIEAVKGHTLTRALMQFVSSRHFYGQPLRAQVGRRYHFICFAKRARLLLQAKPSQAKHCLCLRARNSKGSGRRSLFEWE